MVGRPSRRPEVVGRPSRRFGSNRETIPEVRKWSGDHPGGPEVVGDPPEGSEVVRRPSRRLEVVGDSPEGLELVESPFRGVELVGRPTRRSGTGRETLPEI